MWSGDKGQKGTHQVLGDMIIHYPKKLFECYIILFGLLFDHLLTKSHGFFWTLKTRIQI